jgi:hypothetical protein
MNVFPDWNSIESTTRWSNAFFWVSILCLILPAAAQVAYHIFGNRAAYLITQKTADREFPDNIRSQIVAFLRTTGPHPVEVGYDGNGDDTEQVRFANKIRDLFVDTGWSPPSIAAGRIDLTRPALMGVHFYTKKPLEHIPDYFLPLFDLFDKGELIKERVLNYADYLPDNDSLFVLAGHDQKS